MAFSHDNILDTRTLADELRALISDFDASENDDEQADIFEDIKVYADVADALGLQFDSADTDSVADALEAFGNHNGGLISDGYFEMYAQDYAEDIGAINHNASWPLTYIDWEAAANALQQDFTSVEIDGQTYYYS